MLLAHAAIHDQLGARHQHAGDAERRVDALLFGKIEWVRCAAWIGCDLARRWRHSPPAWQSQALLIAGKIEIRAGAAPIGPAEIADRILLLQVIVGAIALRADRIAVDRSGESAVRSAQRDIAFLVAERAEAALQARRWRQVHAGLRDDVDHPADRAVAVEHGAAVAAGDLDALDAV